MAARADERARLRVNQGWAGPSPKEFDGWTPTYVTEYEYDDDGRLIRSVTRQTDSAWDDGSRGLALALQRYDGDCCSGCGQHTSVLDDPDNNVFTFEERVCRVCAGQDKFGRVVADAHKKAEERLGDNPDPRATRPSDGHRIFIRRATAEEIEQRRKP